MAATVQVAEVKALGGDTVSTAAVEVFEVLGIGGNPPSSVFVRVVDVRASGGVAAAGTVRVVEVVALGGAQAAVLIAHAGPDQSNIEPGVTITLDGSTSSGGVTSGAWTQLSGFAVTLSVSALVQTFVAPPVMDGTTLTFRLTVTDGITNATDDVVITVLEATSFQRVLGAWQGRLVRKRSSGQWV